MCMMFVPVIFPVVGNLPSRESFSLTGKCCSLSDERARVPAVRQEVDFGVLRTGKCPVALCCRRCKSFKVTVWDSSPERTDLSIFGLNVCWACSSLVVIRLSRFSYLSGFKLHFQFVLVTKSTYQAL